MRFLLLLWRAWQDNPGYGTLVEPAPACVSLSQPARYLPICWGYFRSQRFAGDYADFGSEIQISDFEVGRARTSFQK